MEKIYSNFRRVVILGGRERKGGWGGAVIVSGVFYFSEEIPDTNAAKY